MFPAPTDSLSMPTREELGPSGGVRVARRLPRPRFPVAASENARDVHTPDPAGRRRPLMRPSVIRLISVLSVSNGFRRPAA